MTTKLIIMLEDFKIAGQTLYAGNKYPLSVEVADAILECGVAHEEGKEASPRATKPVKIQPSKTEGSNKTKSK